MPHASSREVATILSALSQSRVTSEQVEQAAGTEVLRLGNVVWINRREIYPIGRRLGLTLPESEVEHGR